MYMSACKLLMYKYENVDVCVSVGVQVQVYTCCTHVYGIYMYVTVCVRVCLHAAMYARTHVGL